MLTTLSFIQSLLPGGKVPNHYSHSDQYITIPFAVMDHDDGLDYDIDGNAYWDNPPNDYVAAAFLTQQEAEAYVAKHPDMWIEQDYVEPLWAFTSVHWEGLNSRDEFLAMVMTEAEAKEIAMQAVKAEQEAIAEEAKQDEYDNYYEMLEV